MWAVHRAVSEGSGLATETKTSQRQAKVAVLDFFGHFPARDEDINLLCILDHKSRAERCQSSASSNPSCVCAEKQCNEARAWLVIVTGTLIIQPFVLHDPFSTSTQMVSVVIIQSVHVIWGDQLDETPR